MHLLRQFESLKIDDFEEAMYSYPDHAHLYYEIVYIHHGRGVHHFNNLVIPYFQGDLFLLSPGDHHYFEIEESTHFSFIKFTDNYFNQHASSGVQLNELPHAIMTVKYIKENRLNFSDANASQIEMIVNSIVAYDKHNLNSDSSKFVFFQMLSLLSLISETYKGSRGDDLMNVGSHKVVNYIHENIHTRHLLTVQRIAQAFSISPNYFSNWFRREFNISFREYVTRQRNALLEKRIEHSGMTLKAIANEFDFVDESHLIKYFKKNFGVKPSQYRAKRA